MALIDLRSDTVTHPTDEMRRAMAAAEVGDDVFGEDPTVNALQERAADLMGQEAGLLTASGTMSNLIAALAWCSRGDEMIMGQEAHMFWNESAGPTALAGAQIRLVPNDVNGRISGAGRGRRRPGQFQHSRAGDHAGLPGKYPQPLQRRGNDAAGHQGGGGRCPPPPALRCIWTGREYSTRRLALEVPASELTKDVDDVSFCLSKALSCPVGSVLCGSEEFIGKARKWRKMVGGGMRQAGVLAAAGLVALDSMVERLADDHANARRLAAGLANIDGLTVDEDGIQTNIVIFEVDREKVGDAREVIAALREDGVLVSHSRDQALRMVTHRHITAGDVDEALSRVNGTVRRMAGAGSE